jgi:hypothetical protein
MLTNEEKTVNKRYLMARKPFGGGHMLVSIYNAENKTVLAKLLEIDIKSSVWVLTFEENSLQEPIFWKGEDYESELFSIQKAIQKDCSFKFGVRV